MIDYSMCPVIQAQSIRFGMAYTTLMLTGNLRTCISRIFSLQKPSSHTQGGMREAQPHLHLINEMDSVPANC